MTLNYYKIHDGIYYHVKNEEFSLKEITKKEWKIAWSYIRKTKENYGSSQYEKKRYLVMKKLGEFHRLLLRSTCTMKKMDKIPIDEIRLRSADEDNSGYDIAVGLSN